MDGLVTDANTLGSVGLRPSCVGIAGRAPGLPPTALPRRPPRPRRTPSRHRVAHPDGREMTTEDWTADSARSWRCIWAVMRYPNPITARRVVDDSFLLFFKRARCRRRVRGSVGPRGEPVGRRAGHLLAHRGNRSRCPRGRHAHRAVPIPAGAAAGPAVMRPITATYRLQLRGDAFTLDDARRLADYLDRLGVSHVYLSPILTAMPGSTHGYDVADPTSVSSELGGRPALVALSAELSERGMGLVVDLVPNHLGIGRPQHNRWWWDVLTNGHRSPFRPVLRHRLAGRQRHRRADRAAGARRRT